MPDYTQQELEQALTAINKCEKAMPKLKPNSAQQTLMTRRIKALHIAADLIAREISAF